MLTVSYNTNKSSITVLRSYFMFRKNISNLRPVPLKLKAGYATIWNIIPFRTDNYY